MSAKSNKEKPSKKIVIKSKKGSYNAEHITVLKGLEPVRKRPGMYIGTTGPDGLHHLIWEAFDNARDEAMGGWGGDIEVALLPGNRVRVADNGRGIPVDTHKDTKVSALETIMTTLHAGGKFGGEGYKISGGLHGVGISVANALSVYARAEVHRDGGVFMQEYKQGIRKAKVARTGPSKRTGTIVTFEPDPAIFPEIIFDWSKIVAHLRQQAYLVRGMRVTIIDARVYEGKLGDTSAFYIRDLALNVPSFSFYFEGGLLSLVKFYNRFEKPVHKNVFYTEKEARAVGVESVEIALQYIDDISSRLLAFANNTYNPEGGTHLTGFKSALTRTLNAYARKANFLKEKEENFTGDDALEGLTAVISVKLREVQFEGQTKAKLGSVEARAAVESVFSEAFSAFLEENPDDARGMVNKVLLALKARKAAKAAKDSVLRKGDLEGMTLPGKLADCQSKNKEESELYIVEGDSAGGCWSGETEVALIDGRRVAFKELVREHEQGKKNYCYTIGKNGSVEVGLIEHPRVTKRNTDVINVILDNGEECICTPDHQFMLLNGAYKQAKELTPEDSLMPLYRQYSKTGGRITIDGYEMVYDPATKYWIFTHLLSSRYNERHDVYTKTYGDVIHHVDFNKLNNNPENLVPLDRQEHFMVHTKNLEKTIHRDDIKRKSTAARQTKEFREKARAKSLEKKELFSANAKKQWQSDEHKEFMRRTFLDFYNSNEAYRNNNNVLLNRIQCEHWESAENREKQSERTRSFFQIHPERKDVLSQSAKEQWQDNELRAWRAGETKKQWTPAFRAKRKAAHNETYLRKSLSLLHEIYREEGTINYDRYNEVRQKKGDRSIITHATACGRFFGGDKGKMEDAATHYNHRIKKVVRLSEKMDVYDLEVSDTHNFALANGIFVHNSAKMARDRYTQAILPLFGKVLNVERARLDKVLGSDKFRALVIAMGAGIGDELDLNKLRYHKLIIMADADVDGSHIKTLYLTFFYRYFKSVIDSGFVYIAVPPLYKIQKGKEIVYVYSDEEKAQQLNVMGVAMEEVEEITEEGQEETRGAQGEDQEAPEAVAKKKAPKVTVQRYKGLGEMSAEELWETTMDPSGRLLRQVTVEDAQEADKVFDILMGTDVPARKSFIQSNAKLANIDI